MRCLVLYDIPDDRIRTRIAEVCKDFGLDRIQYSAFAGELSRTHQKQLFSRLRRTLGRAEGRIWLVPLCRADWEGRWVVEQRGKEEG